MTADEWAVAATAAVGTAVGVVFMAVYALSAPWWSQPVGRMMMTLAGALTGLNVIAVLSSGFSVDVVPLRFARAGLITIVTLLQLYQLALVISLHKRRT